MTDSFLTISKPSNGEFKDRGSKFLAYAFPASTEDEWQSALDQVKKEHPKARHFCYAYRLGLDRNNFRANDDGEPSGTAGRPILGQIDSYGLTNVMIIVVRYFGGTLLGTSGLINAYKLSAEAALNNSKIVEKVLEDVFRINFDYAYMGEVMNAVKKLDINIVHQYFQEIAYVEIAIRKTESTTTLTKLKALLCKVSLEEAELIDEMEGIWIN